MNDTIGQSAPGTADFVGSPLADLMELLHSSEAGLRTSDAAAAASPFQDRPAPALVASSLSALVVAVALPYSPFAPWLGFVPVPLSLLGALVLVTIAYLLAVYGIKRWFFARYKLD